jgi:hypothetical protein
VYSPIESNGNALAFFDRPIAARLGVATYAIYGWPLMARRRRPVGVLEPETAP